MSKFLMRCPILRARTLPRTGMRKFLLLALISCSPVAAAQDDARKLPTKESEQQQESSSAGASGDAARARAGANASVEGGAALGETGVNTRPAVKTEEAEKEKRRRDRAKRNEKKTKEK